MQACPAYTATHSTIPHALHTCTSDRTRPPFAPRKKIRPITDMSVACNSDVVLPRFDPAGKMKVGAGSNFPAGLLRMLQPRAVP